MRRKAVPHSASPADVIAALVSQGYHVVVLGSLDEAMVTNPDGEVYATSRTGDRLPYGCSCPAGQYGRTCRHRRLLDALNEFVKLMES